MRHTASTLLVAPPSSTGRDAELTSLLTEHHDAKTRGEARFVFVHGPRGVGKSYLTTQLARELAARGVPVFEGASARDARQPWGVVRPLLQELLTALKRDGVPEAVVGPMAAAMLPLRGGAVKGDDARLKLFDAAAQALTLASRACPLFILPDLDQADLSSLELLRYLSAVAATPGSKVGGLFVLTFREDGPSSSALEEIVRHVPGRSLPLGGLDVEGIRAFISRAGVAEQLLDATGGNPEALSELLERPAPALDFFLRRVDKLEALPREVLSVLALAGQALSAEVISEVLGHELSRTAAALDVLSRERFISMTVADGRSAWRVLREAEKERLVAALPHEEQRRLTVASGRVLAQHGQLHVAAALLLPFEPQEGARLAAQAAEALVARGALEEAGALYAEAVVALPRLSAAHGRVLAALGDYRNAVRALLKRSDEAKAPRALEAGRLLVKLGRFGLARRLLKAASADSALSTRAETALAELLLASGRAADVLALAPSADAALRQTRGKALLVTGRVEEAAAVFEALAREAEASGDLTVQSAARLNEGVAAYKLGDKERAISCWKATHPDSRPLHAHALANLGSVYAEAGDFEAALANLSGALAAFTRFGSLREVAMAASNLSRLHHTLGDLPRAGELSEHALRCGQRLSDGYVMAQARLTLGAIELDRREYAAARRELEVARNTFEGLGNDAWAALAAGLKARAHLHSGERAQAQSELSLRCVEKGSAGLAAASIEVELTRAELSLAAGDLLGAGKAAGRARDTLLDKPELEAPIRTYLLMGRLRQAAGDVAGAQAEYQRAGRLLDELVQRVPPARRELFLSIPRRAEVIAAVEPELRLPRAIASLATPPQVEAFNGFVGNSQALARVTRQLEPIGRSNATVLVRGESGTGKELLADALHALSPRRHMPLIKVNCAAMVEELLLSELFGHEKGAFTGAVRERKGRFELADGGTIFLDEIGDITPRAQVALLRVLQEREFERVGGSKTLKVDVRVICATNRDLEAAIAQGRFRADLYYRLKGVMLELPSLRERLDDLGVLAAHFLKRAGEERGEKVKRLTPQALALLSRHTWPGNIRELENVIMSAAIFAEGDEVDVEALRHVGELNALLEAAPVRAVAAPVAQIVSAASAPVEAARPVSTAIDYYQVVKDRDVSLKELRHELEMQCIRRALEEAGGNISEAARLLKMKRSRLSQIVNGEVELKEVAHGDE